MKAFIEEYGRFLVEVLIGIALLLLVVTTTVQNSKLVSRLIPDERNMSLRFLKNTEVIDSEKIPQMDIVDSVTVLINPLNDMKVDFMSPTIVRSVKDEGRRVTRTNYIPLKYARQESKLKKGYINIIGYDAVNTQIKGDYKVTYQYESESGYKNTHTLIVCVRRPYIPLEWIQATGSQYINTLVVPDSSTTAVSIAYQSDGSGRQDVVWCEGSRMRFGIFVTGGKWGYAYNKTEVVTNIAASGKQSVTLDLPNRKFTVGGATVNISNVENLVGDGHLQLFMPGQTSGKLYECQIYQGGQVELNLFPAYMKEVNAIGLWETEHWTSFKNRGSYYPPFKYGNEVAE